MQRKKTIIWAFYDFASTPVSFAVNSLYLPLMIVGAGGTNSIVGILPLVTGAIAALWTPFVGLVIDRASANSYTRRLIILFSVVIAGCSIIWMANLEYTLSGLILAFTVMSIGIQTGWTAINSFLASEGDSKRMGSLSGIGIVFGYLGGAIGAGGAVIIEKFSTRGNALVFVGVFLILFALIPSLFLRESPNTKSNKISTFSEIFEEIKSNESIKMYLLGSILWGDAISTVMVFASLIAEQVLLIPTENITLTIGLALPFAIFGGFVQGKLGDRYGLVKIQLVNLIIWAVGFASIIFVGSLLPVLLVASIAGFALGGNVALSRGLYAKIIPAGLEGRLFGISAIFAFFGGAIGPLLTGVVADLDGWSLQSALIVPFLFIILSLPTLRYITEEKTSAPFQGKTI